jgi:hypothetical protein
MAFVMGSPSVNAIPPELLALINSGQYRPVNHGAGSGQLMSADGTPLVEFRSDGTNVTDRYDYAEGTGQYYLPQSVLNDPKYAEFVKASGLNPAMQYQASSANPFSDPIFLAGALGLGGAASGLFGSAGGAAAAPFGEMAAAESALAAEAAGLGSASAGGTAALSGAESFVGPATGAVESAPVINVAGGPTVSAVASGAGPFVPVVGGMTGLSNAVSGALNTLGGNASGGGTAAGAAGSLFAPNGQFNPLSLIPAGLGAFASNQQADAIRELANQSRADRAPFLNKSLQYLNDPNSYATGPGAAMLDANLRRLSVGGNPIGDPAKLGIATQAGLQDWRNSVLGFGNLGLAGEDTRAQLGLGAVQADSNVWNSIGSGIAQLTNPQKSIEDMLKGFKFGSLGNGSFSLT